MPKTIKDSNLHETVTIKEVLLKLANNIDDDPLFMTNGAYVDTALAEIRQLLKEAEPESVDGRFNGLYQNGYNDAISSYTANIEKRLG